MNLDSAGFLPCGLVYVALAGSVAAGSPLKGALFMVFFGLGTAPVMFAISMAVKLIGISAPSSKPTRPAKQQPVAVIRQIPQPRQSMKS
ncbi:MAG: sulfite exporter TauE/SafE family protein [FCB group bacterium]|nr:sulfite exporter TauE/SafE family protein [FCB group bacterium]